jgi:hypothetical protein
MSEDLRFDRAALMAAVERELSSSRSIWQGRKLLDSRDDSDSQYGFLDEVLRGRADKSLEHVFSMLAILLPAEPLKVAFRALHSEDRMLRGLALEFLESNLPGDLVSSLRSLVEPSGEPSSRDGESQRLTELMASQQSVLALLRNASAGARAPNV